MVIAKKEKTLPRIRINHQDDKAGNKASVLDTQRGERRREKREENSAEREGKGGRGEWK